MPNGYCGNILRVNLTSGELAVEHPPEEFYRTYLGGEGFVAHYLLREVPRGADPCGPENRLVFAAGVLTGTPLGGGGRNCVGAKSPLTGGYGAAEGGGYFGAEMKYAGFDAIVVSGKAARPAYLWLHDGQAELRDASRLWGKDTRDTEDALREELGDKAIRTATIGPAGEKLVRYAAVVNDVSHFAGRTGLGAVMGSKNLKAIAARGRQRPELADGEKVRGFAKWLGKNVMILSRGLHDHGSSSGLGYFHHVGGLPTRNFERGQFEQAGQLTGETMTNTILVGRGTCFVCPVYCKREVEFEDERYSVNRRYGGPEYETIAAMGATCLVGDLKAIAKANELCSSYGIDTISCGVTISFAMECFERGILTKEDTAGLDLSFGNAETVVRLVEMIGKREGLGDLLAEGAARAAQRIGKGSERYAMHVKGQEVPMHEPRFKQGLGLGYCVSPTGADHNHNMHDSGYRKPGPGLDDVKPLGILEPLPLTDLSPAKVRLLMYCSALEHLRNALVICSFEPYNVLHLTEMVQAVTGWNTSVWELMKVGERIMSLSRAFNVREGFGRKDDRLPERFFEAFASGPLAGVAIDREKLEAALTTYYEMMGWEATEGRPQRAKLAELGIAWAAEA